MSFVVLFQQERLMKDTMSIMLGAMYDAEVKGVVPTEWPLTDHLSDLQLYGHAGKPSLMTTAVFRMVEWIPAFLSAWAAIDHTWFEETCAEWIRAFIPPPWQFDDHCESKSPVRL